MPDNPAFLPADYPRAPEVHELDTTFLTAHHARIVQAIERFVASGHDPTQFALVIEVPPKDRLPPGRVQIHAVSRAIVRNGVEPEFAPMCDVVEQQSPPEGSMWLLLRMSGHTTIGHVSALPKAKA